MSHKSQYIGRGYVGGNALVPSPTPLGAVSTAVGAFPDFHVQGNEAKDVVTGTSLVQAGTAAQNVATTRLIASAPPLPMVTGVLDFPAANDAWQAWTNSINDAGTQSQLMIATWKLRTRDATRNILGKYQVATAGYEHKVSVDGKAQFAVLVPGQAVATTELVGPFLAGLWYTTVTAIDSVANRIGIGTTDGVNEAACEAWTNIVDGDLSNTATYSIGLQRLQAIDGVVLHVTHFLGAKVDALLASGKGPKLIARAAAEEMWWDETRGRIT